MIPGQTDAQVRHAEHERAVHLVDAVAIRKALFGTPVVLTQLERGAVVTICDTHGLSRDLVAEGLEENRRQFEREIAYRRRDLPATRADYLAAAARQPASDLVAAVKAWDRDAVAEVLVGLDVQGLYALAVVLADMANPLDTGSEAAA